MKNSGQRKLNICLSSSSYLPVLGGKEIVVHNLATALTRLGHSVTVFIPYNREGLSFEHNYKIKFFGFRGSGRIKPLMEPLALLNLIRMCLTGSIDVINLHGVYWPGSLGYHLKRLGIRMPVIGTPHGDDIQKLPEIQYGVRLHPVADEIVKRNIRSFDYVTAISPSIHEELAEIGISDREIRDIPNGIWVPDLQDDTRKAILRRKYRIPEDVPVLISVGRNHPKKGFHIGVEAVARLRREGIPFVYLVIGRDMDSLIAQVRRMELSGSVLTPGLMNPEEVKELFQLSDIYISPSLVESFGLTTLEAMSAGLPCIATNVEGSRDLVSSEYGELVEPRNADQLADRIDYLIRNPSIRQAKGKKARDAAMQYDWLRVADMYVDTYRQAIRTTASPRLIPQPRVMQ